MHTLDSKRGALRAVTLTSRRVLWTGLGLAAASLALAFSGQTRAAAQAPAQAPRPGFGDPVNIYATTNNPYAPPREDGELRVERLRGALWIVTGQPGASNVVVSLGNQGVLVVDTGTKAMAPKLLAAIKKLADERGGDRKEIRKIINTNGRLDHVGGNEVISKAGSQIISGEERAQQVAFVAPGAEVVAHENVLRRMAKDTTGTFQGLEPSDPVTFDVDNTRFNGEAVPLHYFPGANTDGQLVVLFRGADVIVAGDIIDMVTYPVIDKNAGGSIDGLLVAINKVIDLAAPGVQAEGGTLIVPGHGRLADQAEVALYRNMLTIVRNTIQYYKNEGKTLQQVLDLKPTEGYDQRWGRTTGPWTTKDFVTAIYETLPAKGPVFFSFKNSTTANSGKAF